MDYKALIADLFGIATVTTKAILASAINEPILGEAIAIVRNYGFDARKKADWESRSYAYAA